MSTYKTLLACASTLALGVSLATSATAADSKTLPQDIQKSIRSAFFTNDKFVINTVTQAAKNANPAFSAAIDNFIVTLQKESSDGEGYKFSSNTATPAQLAAKAPAAGKKKAADRNWKGSVEAGANFATGNTKQQALSLSGDLTIKVANNITNQTKVLAEGDKQNGVRTQEEYTLENKTKWNFAEKDYAFFDLEYVNDRFSGQEYRITELLGYGRDLYQNETMKLTGEASVGMVQTKYTGLSSENSAQGKISGIYNWQITDTISFNEELSYSVNSDFNIIESDTAIKSDLSESLYLKFGVNVERISDVPVGTKKTDTVTKLTVGYDF